MQKQWEELGLSYEETKKLVNKGLKTNDCGFAYYLKQKDCQLSQINNLFQLQEEYFQAQTWLDFWYPKEGVCMNKEDEENYNKTRGQITKLKLDKKNLQGSLKIEGFIKLKELSCGGNQLTNLEIKGSDELQWLHLHNNQLTSLGFLDDLNEKNLTWLNVSSNNFSSDLTPFSKFVNLEGLYLGNFDNYYSNYEEQVKQGIYNRFYGSLEPLARLVKLWQLFIINTDIDSGLEHLPDSVGYLSCLASGRSNAKCQNIANLFANEKGEIEIDNYRWIKNFPQKLQEIKQKNIKEKSQKLVKENSQIQELQNQLTQLTIEKNYLQGQLSKFEGTPASDDLVKQTNAIQIQIADIEQKTQIIQQQPFGIPSSSKPK